MASFRKRNDLWEYRISYKDNNGKYKIKSKSGFKTKKEAQLSAHKALEELENSNSIKEMLLSEYLLDWYKIYIKGKRNPTLRKRI